MNLTSEVQRRIIPPHVPFASSHINFFHLNHNTEAQIKENALLLWKDLSQVLLRKKTDI